MKNKIKYFLLGVIVTSLLTSSGLAKSVLETIQVRFNSVSIEVNGKKVDTPNILYKGTTYAPLRATAELLGKEVTWNQDTYTAGINDKATENNNDSNKPSQSANSFTYKDESGKALYSIEIKGIKKMTERNQYSDKNPEEVYIIDYSYKNIDYLDPDGLYISGIHFKVVDSKGKLGYEYPNSITNYPQETPKGIACDGQMIFGVDNKSSEITLLFSENLSAKSDATFKLKIK